VVVEDCARVRQDHEELFIRYSASIDFDGALSVQHCLFGDEGIDRNVYKTKCISVFDGDRLIAGGYFDLGNESAASILHFFDPVYKSKSLGKYLLLITADFLQEAGYTYYYPGYLVAGLPKMDYKLFMGKEATQYFDPETQAWMSFHEGILLPEEPGDEDRMELNNVFGVGEGLG
jgi:arginine-tRNA-protein transferase